MMRALIVFFALLPSFSMGATWYKGNIHTHTTDSDGQQTPAQVIQWYIDHGYNFLALTDHNWFSSSESAGFGVAYNGPNFLMIPGEEVTDTSTDRNVIHLVALNIASFVPITSAGTSAQQVSADASAITAAGG